MKTMKKLPLFLFAVLFPAFAWPQTQGTVNCRDGIEIPAWEKPGSILQIKQLKCGVKIVVLGKEYNYYKVLIGNKIVGYVDKINLQVDEQLLEKSLSSALPVDSSRINQQQPAPELSQTANPEKSKAQKQSQREIPVLKSGFEAGIEIHRDKYNEPGIMKQSGTMFGLYGSYTIHPNHFMVKLDARFAIGKVSYTSNETGSMDGVKDRNFEARFSFGHDFKLPGNSYLIPFSGLGIRYLLDESGGMSTDTGYYGYTRESHYLYTPLGLEAVTRINRDWLLSVETEYDLFWHGWQYSELGDVIGDDFVLKSDQPHGWGVRGNIKITKRFGRYVFSLSPFIRYWNIRASDIVLDWYEPPNHSTEGGVRIGMTF
jgi:hypothetical protein